MFLPSLLLTLPILTTASQLPEFLQYIQTQSQSPSSPPEFKYFHEPGTSDDLGHYDARFFRGTVPYDQHRPALRHLIRSYLTILPALGVDTWLAHGTLLGWWWNGRILPWDADLDVQVASSSLEYLGRFHNQSLHSYHYLEEPLSCVPNASDPSPNHSQAQTQPTPPRRVEKTYLLDINPHHSNPNRGIGLNVIDARWIDTDNGMFIDITGLRERTPDTQPGLWGCKNFHRYTTRQLWPMRETEFEGVKAKVPFDFDRALVSEYGRKALVLEEWEG